VVTHGRDYAHRRDSSELGVGSLVLPPERQPGDRLPAPAPLALVQAFVNSRWDLDRKFEDRFATPPGLARWLADHELLEPGARVSSVGHRRTLEVRDGLHALLFANNGHAFDPAAVERLNLALRGSGVFVQLEVQAPPDFRAPRRDLDGALATIAAIVALAQLDGSWARLKACPGRHCGWTFYDHSRNQTGSWCSMSVCGSRTKAREYRQRRRPT
jgi:predicted RNA-binding Zn ribbon-like protein